MTQKNKILEYNQIVLKKLSVFLNYEPDFVQESIISELCTECSLSPEEAFSYVLAAAVGMDTENNPRDREIFSLYFPQMLHCLDAATFDENPYLREIWIPACVLGDWEFKYEVYKPYEAFACDDLLSLRDGRIIPQIGFFTREFRYPAVLQKGREWMLITPNEIRTMEDSIKRASGKVLTFGLGLGYFAFMAARKPEVSSVTVVEIDENVIALFDKYIRPQISCADKIQVILDDAFSYAEKRMQTGGYDFVFADIWHDPSDGVSAYRRLKPFEKLLPDAEFRYWIEPTLRCYM